MDPNPPLTTARLRLEPQVARHAPAMMAFLADPAIYRFLPDDPPRDEAALRARYARLESRRSPDGSERWLNWTVFRGDRSIGTVQASVRGEVADVAYVFAPSEWGRGYAGEAVAALLDHLRAEASVARARANVDSRNLASQRLLARLGFVRIGEVKGADAFKGAVSDELVYELALARGARPEREGYPERVA